MENTLPNTVVPVHAMKPYGGMALDHHTFLTSALDARRCSASSPSHFTPRKKSTRYILHNRLSGAGIEPGHFVTLGSLSV
jgi:hypothetical protein